MTVACPHCGLPVALPTAETTGRRFACPHCRQPLVLELLPEKNAEAAQPPEPSAKRRAKAPLPPGWIPLEPAPAETDSNSPSNRTSDSAPTSPGPTLKPGLDDLSPLGAAAGLSVWQTRRQATRQRRRKALRLIIPGSIAVGIAVAAALFALDRMSSRAARDGRDNRPETADHSSPSSQRDAPAEQPPVRTPDRSSAKDERSAAPTRPIRLLLAPDGVRMVIHLRPARLWGEKTVSSPPNVAAAVDKSGQSAPSGPKGKPARSRGEEFRAALEPLSAWAERQIRSWCLFPPSQIEEVVFSFVLRSPDDPPDVAATVWLKNDTSAAEVAKRFGGRRVERGRLAVYSNAERTLVIRDARTFAIGPQAAAGEMVAANDQPNPTDESIEELLKQTDRRQDITVLFRPDDLDRFRGVLFPAALQGLAHGVAGWLDPDAVEGAGLSLRLADPFRIRLELRNRPATTIHQLRAEMQAHLDKLPAEVLEYVKTRNPPTIGQRKLVGRLPAMWKAVALGASSASEERLLTIESILPERAAPNLSLATSLALAESGPSAGAPARAPGSQLKRPKTIAERLATPIDVDFRRTPFSEAFGSIGEDTGLTFELDGGGLKLAGYTKNMPQTLRITGTPAIDVLRAVLKPYPKLVLVIDEPRQTVIVTTREAADAKGQKPLAIQK